MGDKRSSLIQKLRKFVQSHPAPKESEQQSVEWMTMLEIENTLFQKNSEKIPSFQEIPPFFFSKNSDKSPIISQLISKEAQKIFQRKQKDKIMTSEDLDALWEFLLSNATPPIKDSEESINYEGFEKVRDAMINFLLKNKMKPSKKLTLKPLSGLGTQKNDTQAMSPRQKDAIKKQVVKKVGEYLNPVVFMRMNKDDLGRISIPNYFNFVLRKISLIQSRIELMSFDEDGKNSLTRKELSKFIGNQIPKLPSLANMDPTFKDTYIETAVEKFFFFLDMIGKGSIAIDTILGSNILIEFNELQNTSLSPEELMENWFSVPSTLSVFKTFLDLDLSKTKMLAKADFARFNHATFTKTFIDRLFEEHPSTANEMTYRDFVRFILAYENKDSKPGLKYYWKILDVEKRGYITPFEIGMFFKAMTRRIIEKKIEPIPLKNVIRELFEMVQPVEDCSKITFEELFASKQGPNFVLFFGDFNAFWRYENREMQATED